MARKFSAGDLVQLKSGGPVMTVESVNYVGAKLGYQCAWFVLAKHHRQHFFEPTLKAAELERPLIRA